MNALTGGPARVLVAGIGNIFLGDDGFGVEVVRRLRARELPPGVEVADIGVRGVHLAYQLLDGYDTLIVVDATRQGAAPGTIHLIEHAAGPAPAVPPPVDGHHMGPDAVLALLGTLAAGTGGRPPRRVLVVGCEPASLDEGIGLTPAVEAAVDDAVALVLTLVPPPTGASTGSVSGALTGSLSGLPAEAPSGEVPAGEAVRSPGPFLTRDDPASPAADNEPART